MSEQEKQIKLIENAIKELTQLIPLVKSGQATIVLIAISIQEKTSNDN